MDFSFDFIDSWQSGLQCNFHFGYGLDLIEEDALNEQCCLQVLRIMILKADDEIGELENYLVCLQNELAWVEYGDWSEICCNAFRKRIDFLDVSIKALRNTDTNDVEVKLLLHTEPAEKVDDILKTLLKSYCHKIDKQNGQPLNEVVMNSKFDSQGDVWLLENQKLSTTDLNVAANEEAHGPCVSHKDSCTSIDTSSELVQKKPHHSERVEDLEKQPDDADSKDQKENLLALAPDHSDENIVANMVNVENLRKQGAKGHDYSLEDKIFIQSSPSKPAEKRMLGLEMVKSSELALNASNMDAKDYSIVYLNKKKLASSSLITNNEEAKGSLLSTENAIILYSSPISVERMMDLIKEIKPANIPVSSVCNHTTSLPKEMNKSCDSSFQVNGNEIQEYRVPANSKSATSNVSLFPGCKGSVSNTDKPSSAMVKKISPDTLKHATSVKRGGDNSDSLLCGFRQKKGSNSDVAPRKQSMKATKVSSTDKMGSSGSLSMGEGKRKEPLLVVKVEETEASPTKTLQSALTAHVRLQAEKEQIKTCFQQKGGEIRLEENLRLSLPIVPPGKVAKTNIKANPSKELILHSKENHLTSFSGKKRAVPSFLVQGENSSKKRAVPSFLLQGKKQGELKDCRNSVSASTKKRKKPTTSPFILGIGSSPLGFDFSNLQEGTTDSAVKKECLDIVLYAGDSNIRPSSSALKNLMELKLPDLKAIAKAHKLTKYHKLRKSDLVEKIVNRLARV